MKPTLRRNWEPIATSKKKQEVLKEGTFTLKNKNPRKKSQGKLLGKWK